MISPRFFQPRSIAVVGVSKDTSKVGSQIFANLRNGFRGTLYPIHPKAKKIHGYKVYENVASLPEVVDLVIIVIPAAVVLPVLEACAEKGIRHVVIISGGFGEQGREGQEREREITRVAEEYGLTVLGPNCLGFLVPRLQLNASFGPSLPPKGEIAFFSQSGAMAVALMDRAEKEKLGFSLVVSMGNKTVVNETDLLRFAAEDQHTKVIALYLENIEEGSEFLKVAYEVSRRKPIILLKAGRTEAGSQAIASHTGKIAGDARVFDAYCEDRGILQVRSEEELLIALRLFGTYTKTVGKRLGIVTNAGGPGVLLADGLEEKSIVMANLSKNTKEQLKLGLTSQVSVENPVDILGDGTSTAYEHAARLLCTSGEVDMLAVILTPQTATDVLGTARVLVKIRKEFPHIPIVVSFLGGRRVEEGIAYLLRFGVVHCSSLSHVILVLEMLYQYTLMNRRRIPTKITSVLRKATIRRIIESTTGVLSIEDTHRVMKSIGAPLLPMKIIKTKNDIKEFPKSYYPVVLKVDNTHVLHKTDIGGVVLNIQNNSALERAWNDLKKSISVPYFIAEKMSVGSHIELFVGAKRTEFGDVLVVGMGGIYAELFSDHCIVPAPFTEKRVRTFLRQKSFWRILTGARGLVYDEGAAVATIVRIASLFELERNIQVVDVNPLFVYVEGAQCIDVKITV